MSVDQPPISPQKEKSKIRRLFSRLALALGVLIGVLAVATGVLAYWPDTNLKDDADLIPLAEKIEAGLENPATKIEAITDWQLPDEDKALLKIKPADRSEEDWEHIAKILQRESEMLNLMRRSADQLGWKHHIEYSFNFQTEHLKSIRSSMVLLKENSLMLLRDGKADKALDEAVTILKLGKRMEEGGGNIIYKLIAIAGSGMGKTAIFETLKKGDINQQRLRQLMAEITNLKLVQADFADGFRVEYQSQKEMFGKLDQGKIDIRAMRESSESRPLKKRGKPAFFQLNRSINSMAASTRGMIKDAEGFPSEQIFQKEVMEPAIRIRQRGYLMFVSPNAVGNILLSISAPAYARLSLSHAHARSTHELFVLYVAARLFESVENRSIQSLEELVPNYIDKIPIDPFDGKPIRFNPSTHTAYSVGSDFIDEKGQYSGRKRGKKLPHDIKQEPSLRLP